MNRFSALAAVVTCSALTALAAWAASPAPLAPPAPAQAPAAAEAPGERHTMSAACAKVCADCMLACEKTAHHCAGMVEAGKKEHGKPMQLAADCAEFCSLAARLTARHSDLAPAACEACAAACDLCVGHCDKFADMPEMKACAVECRKCATHCREVAKRAAR